VSQLCGIITTWLQQLISTHVNILRVCNGTFVSMIFYHYKAYMKHSLKHCTNNKQNFCVAKIKDTFYLKCFWKLEYRLSIIFLFHIKLKILWKVSSTIKPLKSRCNKNSNFKTVYTYQQDNNFERKFLCIVTKVFIFLKVFCVGFLCYTIILFMMP
jgi:hypothetical protein